MGTRKKLILASLVGVMMMLAFIIGLVPSHDTDRSGAAVPSNGRVDMVDILDLILGSAAKQDGVTLESRVDGVVVKTPEDNAEIPAIPVPLQATVEGDGNDLVTFVANEANDRILLAVWRREGADDTVTLPLRRWAGRAAQAELRYPGGEAYAVPFQYNAEAGSLTVTLPKRNQARYFVVRAE